ncbi:MAG: EAL domain-containing protein [Gemmatimonadetes bacterium]|nr:EAL domain-containing protein [Gemmatimonadota bacterium]
MPNASFPHTLPNPAAIRDRIAHAFIEEGLSTELLRSIIDRIDVPIIACDAKGFVVLINRAFAAAHPTPERGAAIATWIEQFQYFEPDGVTPMERVDAPMLRALRGEPVEGFEYAVRSPEGVMFHRRAWGHRLTDGAGTVLGAVIALLDVTDQRQGEEALRRQALHDPLTGLPNRSLLRDRLQHALSLAKRRNRPIGLVFFDLDRFKRINDSFGHTVGDDLLVLVARRLQSILRPEDTLGRLGGDEFVVILEDLDDPGDARRVGDRIRQVLSAPMDVGSHLIRTTASVGVALADPARHTADDLLREADTAMYGAKERGRNRTEVFDEAMHQRALQRIATEQMLVHALHNDGLVVLYQPFVDSATGRMVGAEALVRCRADDGELLMPAAFVSVAEETGLISDIDRLVLETVCQVAAELAHERPGRELRFSCNVSGRFVDQDDFAELVKAVLAKSGCPPEVLCLEITETTLIQATAKTRTDLAALRATGIQIAIDDFGTGYSSLTYLRDFPVSDLKIDRSFIARMWQDGDLAIVDAVVRLAIALGMLVTAEGVESRDQAVTLRRLGVAQLQGHWFGYAMPREELRAKLHSEVPGFV